MLPAKILLISADASTISSISTCLLQASYKVVNTTRGSTAIELIRAENPALIVLDIELPDYNNLSIIRALRSGEQNHRIPVIMVGTALSEEDVLIGLEVGADLCLLETIHPQVFVARVRSLLRRNQLLKAF